jgi:LEA14-like dessication related protein
MEMKQIHGKMLGFALVASMIATSCGGAVKRPEIELVGMRLGGIGLRGASLVAELDITNPNDFTIETDSVAYRLFANTSSSGDSWQPVLQRTHTQRIVIPEDEKTRVEIPIEFNYSEMSGAARSILDRGTFNYRIEGNAYVREPLKRTIPFTKTGNVSLSGAR